MSRVLIIGCGGVANVAIRKCCQVSEVFSEICIASRTKEKCDQLAGDLEGKTTTKITTAKVDADDVNQIVELINEYKPELVMNIALPYQDLTIMDACLICGVNYMDTANYEPEDIEDPEWKAIYEKRCEEKGFSAYFDYSWQWAYREKFEKAGLTALLGCGFDPGVTQAYCAYAKKHEFDTIDTIDILDCNGGDHGYPFATNFNPEVNLREVSAPGSYWEDGLLPDPASLGPRTHGKTNIGCIFTGKKDGKEKSYYLYNVCDHQECYKEAASQAISYTTGVPAMCGAMMLLTGKWTTTGVHTVEEFDPDPFLEALDQYGLPRNESYSPVLVD